MKKKSAVCLVVVAMVASVNAIEFNIPVTNHSFEADILGDGAWVDPPQAWTNGGAWSAAYNPGARIEGETGTNVAGFNNTGWLRLSAGVDFVFVEGYTYTLIVDVGRRKDTTIDDDPASGYEIGLDFWYGNAWSHLPGHYTSDWPEPGYPDTNYTTGVILDNPLGWEDDPADGDGEMISITNVFTCPTAPVDAYTNVIGQQINIWLYEGTNANDQTVMDNVRLYVETGEHPPINLTLDPVSGTDAAISWNTRPAIPYKLQGTDDLTLGWGSGSITNLTGGLTNSSVTVTSAMDQVQSFYRVIVE